MKEIEEKENRDREIESGRKEMNQKIDLIMELIQQNNKLTNVKPDVLLSALRNS
jgi:hypothetical protein